MEIQNRFQCKMEKRKIHQKIFYCAILILSFSLTSCFTPFLPITKIISQFRSSKISNYQLERIALLPMTDDDTTNTGTFYSTNHFINKLSARFPKIKFEISDISEVIKTDSLAVPKLVDSIEKNKYLKLSDFYNSDWGKLLPNDAYDAMFIGAIDSCYDHSEIDKLDWNFDKLYVRRVFVRSCYFSYYLISLLDGKVLWKAKVLGEAANYEDTDVIYHFSSSDEFPPLDSAISAGIDKMIPTILLFE